MIEGLGDLNASLGLTAIGSALGIGVAGMAAIGAWKKAFSQNKTAPFMMIAFVGAPLTQIFYGFILRNKIQAANLPYDSVSTIMQMTIGLMAGLAMGSSAYMQGKAAARACDALAETGKGFANYMLVLGIIETVALFVMIFSMIALPG
ncbi:MAG: V-type ATP synthase subunit K [Candidatus Kaelpia imicola]|nr:V-type ATP synthase subunit K [Candidatus Kaelpia imicola]